MGGWFKRAIGYVTWDQQQHTSDVLLWPPRPTCQDTERLPTLPCMWCLDARRCDPLSAAAVRYPEGESYLDLVARLWPVVHQLEQRTSPVVVVAHQVGGKRYCTCQTTVSCRISQQPAGSGACAMHKHQCALSSQALSDCSNWTVATLRPPTLAARSLC